MLLIFIKASEQRERSGSLSSHYEAAVNVDALDNEVARITSSVSSESIKDQTSKEHSSAELTESEKTKHGADEASHDTPKKRLPVEISPRLFMSPMTAAKIELSALTSASVPELDLHRHLTSQRELTHQEQQTQPSSPDRTVSKGHLSPVENTSQERPLTPEERPRTPEKEERSTTPDKEERLHTPERKWSLSSKATVSKLSFSGTSKFSTSPPYSPSKSPPPTVQQPPSTSPRSTSPRSGSPYTSAPVPASAPAAVAPVPATAQISSILQSEDPSATASNIESAKNFWKQTSSGALPRSPSQTFLNPVSGALPRSPSQTFLNPVKSPTPVVVRYPLHLIN